MPARRAPSTPRAAPKAAVIRKPAAKRPVKKATTPSSKTATRSAKARADAHVDELDAAFVGKLLPYLRMLRGYTRLKADGLQNVPEGPAILAANHTGWLGLDYALTAVVLHDEAGRTPRGMVHAAWFLAPATASFARKVGLSKVSKASMAAALRQGHLVMVFPEGERGAFRPGEDYTTSEFARGFVRVAAAEGIPIVPVAILGGAESNPVGRTIRSYEELLRLQIPVPTNVLPKPVKWRIRFLPPVDAAGLDPGDAKAMHAAADGVRATIQEALGRLQAERGHPYL